MERYQSSDEIERQAIIDAAFYEVQRCGSRVSPHMRLLGQRYVAGTLSLRDLMCAVHRHRQQVVEHVQRHYKTFFRH